MPRKNSIPAKLQTTLERFPMVKARIANLELKMKQYPKDQWKLSTWKRMKQELSELKDLLECALYDERSP